MVRERSGSSAFKRLALLFFLTVLVVSVGVSYILFRNARIQERADEEARNKTIAQSVRQLEEQIQAVYHLAENLSVDNRLAQIAYHMHPNEYERSRLVLGIISNIRSMCDLNTFIEDVKVAFPVDSLELSNINGYDKWREYSAPDEAEHTLLNCIFYSEGRLRIRISFPLISRVMGSEPDYECEVVFSQRFLDSYLTMFGESEKSGAMLIAKGQNGEVFPITKHEPTPMTAYVMEKIKNIDTYSLHEEIRLENGRFTISYETSEQYPITLVTWQSVNLISANMITALISVISVILVSSVFFLFLNFQTNRSVAQPIYQLMDAFQEVQNGDLSTRIRHDKNDEFHFIYDSFNGMTLRIEQLIKDIKEQHNLLQNAELMQLQAQINPHFLYNSFLVILYMASGEEYEQITEYVSALAEYYRFVNKESRQAIPLSAEVKHMRSYIYIQQKRFEGRIRTEEGVLPEETGSFLVPKLILQPLVENCYNHGLQNKLEDGVISIAYELEGDILVLRISDNGEEMNEERLAELRQRITETDEQSVCHALANTRRRLELAYGNADMLSLSIGKEGGLQVTLTFNLTQSPSNSL